VLHAQAPYPSFADVAYVAAYPFLIAGAFSIGRGWGRPRLSDLLDTWIVGLAALIILFGTLVEPVLAKTALSPAGTLLTLGTTAADLVLFAIVAQLSFRTRVVNASLRFLLVAFAFVVVADIVYAYLNLRGAYTSGMIVDAGWIASYVFWGCAALHPSMAKIEPIPREETAGFSGWRSAILICALLASPIAAITKLYHDTTSVLEVGVGALIMTSFVALRVAVLQRERNRMQGSLLSSEQKYRELFAEADAARVKLAEQNDQLRQLDRLKDDLIALVSHELRTPLTSISGYLELLMEGEESFSEDQRAFLDVIDRNAERLLRLVTDLLFVAQAQAGRLTLDQAELDLCELVEEAVTAALPVAEERKIMVSYRPSVGAFVRGDRVRLAQVIDNLLSNALKFTPPGGVVRVSVRVADEEVALEVADNGIGIPEDQQTELFDRFYRARSAVKKAIQGTGLGLSIVKAIAEAHGGSVSVASLEGEGSVFRVVLPKIAVHERVKEAA
jgi:signal transduction histidine kinase